MLERLKYVSRFSRPLAMDEVMSIATDAARRNASEGLTGILVTAGDVFMQILEGPEAPLEQVFARIAQDSRHRDVVVIRRTKVTSRLFGGWSMKLLELDAEDRDRLVAVLRLIEACGRGSDSAASRLYDLDDAIWKSFGARAAASSRRAG